MPTGQQILRYGTWILLTSFVLEALKFRLLWLQATLVSRGRKGRGPAQTETIPGGVDAPDAKHILGAQYALSVEIYRRVRIEPLEDKLDEMAPLIRDFLDRKVVAR